MTHLLLLLQAAALASSPSAAPLVSATRYEYKTESTSPGPDGTPINATGKMRATVSGSLVRYEVIPTPVLVKIPGEDSTRLIVGPDNSYTLMHGTDRIYSVDTVKREYFLADMGKMESGLSEALAGLAMMNFKVSGAKMDVKEVGQGDKVMNYATSHWRMSGTFTITMAAMSDTVAITMEESSDFYYARELMIPFMRILQPDSAMVSGPLSKMLGEDNAKIMSAGYSKLPKATPVKTVTRMTMMMGMMDMAMSNTTELTSIEKVEVPAAYFELPKDYKQVEMPLPSAPKQQ